MLAVLDFSIIGLLSLIGFVFGVAGVLSCVYGIYERIKAKNERDRDSALFFICIDIMFGSILLGLVDYHIVGKQKN